MSVSVKVNCGGANCTMNDRKVLSGFNRAGHALPYLTVHRNINYVPFGGVIDESQISGMQKMKLVNLERFWWNEDANGCSYDFPSGHIVVGVLMNGKSYIVIKEDAPLHYNPNRNVVNK